MNAQIYIGIDLGTSNSALATSSENILEELRIPQFTSSAVISEKTSLASSLYSPIPEEINDRWPHLPWQELAPNPEAPIVGAWAKDRGIEVPNRVVHSAKSWLCHSLVDRKTAILPWESDISTKLSPIEASTHILNHLKKAFENKYPQKISDLFTVLTVPASFDEVARTLTLEAAAQAGIKNVTLLEEPQAALYSWIAAQKDAWRKHLAPGDTVLVVDVGGGTTDFSLIAVNEVSGDLALERIAVGDHLLLGGDNMDLSLAYFLKNKLEKEGV